MNNDTQNYMNTLSDEQLKEAFKVAKIDLEKAATSEHESEWHEACFAATILFAEEISKRKRVNFSKFKV